MRAFDQTRYIEARARAGWSLLPHLHELYGVARSSAATLLERHARTRPNGSALLFLNRKYSWAEVNEHANRWARLLLAHGVIRRDVIALMMDNRPEYVFALLGASKIQAVVACVNTNVTGAPLAHAIGITKARLVVAGSEHEDSARAALDQMTGRPAPTMLVHLDDGGASRQEPVNQRLVAFDSGNLGGPRPAAEEPATYLYTSGTTGLPKAAIVTHRRFLVAAYGFGKVAHEAGPEDTIYVPLPLYHGTGQWGGLGAALTTGAAVALRRKFSASAFWKDVVHYRATRILYIGELCRYLVNQPESPEDTLHSVRVAVGNGLRPDVWEPFQTRFGIPMIREFYGATEGNAPIINLEGKRGMLGRLGRRHALLACDPESGTPRRDGRGRCERLRRPGETGLFVARLAGPLHFDGYVDPAATSAKVLRDVFRPGDAWFDSGDLMTLHEHRWVSFADRVGDTFRWKGENVSTTEVALLLNRAANVLESNVFGVSVPGADGKAGMACLVTTADFDIEAFGRYANRELPRYARPLFVRLLGGMRITQTFKHQKADYRSEGYDPARTTDRLFVLVDGAYVPMTAELYQRIHSGRVSPG